MTYKTHGIIIKRRNFGEADRILSIFTEKYGKVTAIAKGVRKPLSKFGGHLELFYLTDFQLVEGRNLDIIVSAELVDDFPDIRKNRSKFYQVFLISELINNLTSESDSSQSIYILICQTLKNLNNDKRFTLANFMAKILTEIGHEPEVSVCVKCREKLIENINYFSNNLGGLLCANCQKYDLASNAITPNAVKLLRLFLKKDLLIVNKIAIEEAHLAELEKMLIDFSQSICEKKLMSLDYLKN